MANNKPISMSGRSFGSWTVVQDVGSKPYGGGAYLCRCDCGNERVIDGGSLRRGSSTSCGCVARKLLLKRITKHGLTHHPMNKIWDCMIQRCTNPNHIGYDRYGGRGIQVCERWRLLENFFDDNKDTWVHGYQLERIDNDGNYCPENCTWIHKSLQARNRCSSIRLTHNGETRPLVEWAELLGISALALRERRRKGWSVEKMLTTPWKQRAKTASL